MKIKFCPFIKGIIEQGMRRYNAVKDARYAFSTFDLEKDVYTVAKRYRGKDGVTTGASLVKKNPQSILDRFQEYVGDAFTRQMEEIEKSFNIRPNPFAKREPPYSISDIKLVPKDIREKKYKIVSQEEVNDRVRYARTRILEPHISQEQNNRKLISYKSK